MEQPAMLNEKAVGRVLRSDGTIQTTRTMVTRGYAERRARDLAYMLRVSGVDRNAEYIGVCHADETDTGATDNDKND